MALTDLIGSNRAGLARAAVVRPSFAGLAAAAAAAAAAPPAAPTPPVTAVAPPAWNLGAAMAQPPPFEPDVAVIPGLRPGLTPGHLPDLVRPGVALPAAARPTVATELARHAIELLRATPPGVLGDAITAVGNASIAPQNLMAFLARRVLIGEVLGGRADGWSEETRADFAEALNLGSPRTDQMDAIVALAVLNDPDLEQEVRGENLTEPTDAELMSNRRVVWQYPPAGTPLEPPYVVLIAVERQDVAQAETVIRSIFGALGEQRGFRVPAGSS